MTPTKDRGKLPVGNADRRRRCSGYRSAAVAAAAATVAASCQCCRGFDLNLHPSFVSAWAHEKGHAAVVETANTGLLIIVLDRRQLHGRYTGTGDDRLEHGAKVSDIISDDFAAFLHQAEDSM